MRVYNPPLAAVNADAAVFAALQSSFMKPSAGYFQYLNDDIWVLERHYRRYDSEYDAHESSTGAPVTDTRTHTRAIQAHLYRTRRRTRGQYRRTCNGHEDEAKLP